MAASTDAARSRFTRVGRVIQRPRVRNCNRPCRHLTRLAARTSIPILANGSTMPGKRDSHYEVVRPLGTGCLSVVYEAEASLLGRCEVLKVLPAEPGRVSQA